MPWSDVDLSELAGGPPASRGLMGYVTSLGGQGPTARVVYVSEAHVHELSLVSGGQWGHADLTDLAGGPNASGEPMGYATSLGGQGPAARVVYWGADAHVHELSLVSGGQWGHADLTDLAGGPNASGEPMGYATSLGGQGPAARVVYWGADAHVHELSLVSGGQWGHADLTDLAGGPASSLSGGWADLRGYTTSMGGQGPTARVVYVSDGHVHELSLVSGGRWGDADLTGLAGGPRFGGTHLSAYNTDLSGQGPAARILYGAGNVGGTHELSLVSGGQWSHADLTELAGAADGHGSMGYATSLSDQGPTARVVYVSDGHVHELSMVSGGQWGHTDLTDLAGGPNIGGALVPAVLMGYATDLGGQGSTARVIYLAGDGHVHELSLVAPSPSTFSGSGSGTVAPPPGAGGGSSGGGGSGGAGGPG